MQGFFAPFSFAHAAHAQTELNVFKHAQKGEQRQVLPHQRGVPLPGIQVVDALAVQANFTAAGLVEPGKHAQRGGFTTATGAHDRDELALVDFQVHRFDSDVTAEVFGHVIEYH